VLGVGRIAAVLAVALCGLAAVAGLFLPRRARPVRALALVGAGCAAAAVAVLGRAFVAHDFSLVYVADHSRRCVGAWDRVAGIWGAMDGSLLLFGALVVVLGVAGTRTARATAVAMLNGWWSCSRFDRTVCVTNRFYPYLVCDAGPVLHT
jgi:cytochrome c-type biogenesis protein CcmF